MLYSAFLAGNLLFAVLMLGIISSAFFGFLITRVPFVRTSSNDIKYIVRKLKISSDDVFYDLGSGDGRVCFLVNRLTGAKCVGFELVWWTYALAALKAKWKGQNAKLQFKNKNFFKIDWSEANYIYAYLYPPLMGRIEEKFLKECKTGSIAVVRDFPFPDLKPAEVFYLPEKHEIYVYKR